MGLGATLPNHIPACRSELKMKLTHKSPFTTILDGGLGGRVAGWPGGWLDLSENKAKLSLSLS